MLKLKNEFKQLLNYFKQNKILIQNDLNIRNSFLELLNEKKKSILINVRQNKTNFISSDEIEMLFDLKKNTKDNLENNIIQVENSLNENERQGNSLANSQINRRKSEYESLMNQLKNEKDPDKKLIIRKQIERGNKTDINKSSEPNSENNLINLENENNLMETTSSESNSLDETINKKRKIGKKIKDPYKKQKTKVKIKINDASDIDLYNTKDNNVLINLQKFNKELDFKRNATKEKINKIKIYDNKKTKK
jgi:hypothetical protein